MRLDAAAAARREHSSSGTAAEGSQLRPSEAQPEQAEEPSGTALAQHAALQQPAAAAAVSPFAAAGRAPSPSRRGSCGGRGGCAGRASLGDLRIELSTQLAPSLEEELQSWMGAQSGRDPGSLPQQQAAAAGGAGGEDAARLSDWEITADELEICRRPDGSLWQLGAGGFGRVYRALRFGVQPVAVKCLAPTAAAACGGQVQEEFRNEMRLLRACKDPNIVSFLGASLSPDFTLLVLELCEGGALSANLRAGRISWYRRGKQVAIDVARGLAYLHGRRMIHLDLKSPNILLDRHGRAKIADFGVAKVVQRELSAVSASLGTLDWAAPEVLLGLRCTEKANVFSFGVCLWEIATGEVPCRGRMRPLSAPRDCPAAVAYLVAECMDPDPSRRPSAQQLVQRLSAAPGALPAASEAGEEGMTLRAGAASPPLPPRPPPHSRSLAVLPSCEAGVQQEAAASSAGPPAAQVAGAAAGREAAADSAASGASQLPGPASPVVASRQAGSRSLRLASPAFQQGSSALAGQQPQEMARAASSPPAMGRIAGGGSAQQSDTFSAFGDTFGIGF